MKNILFPLLLVHFSPIFSQWQEISTPTNEDLNTIEIINNNAFCGGKNGVLLKSLDQGETWTEITTSASGSITSIHFINSSIGFFTTSLGKIFKTLNGGIDWTEKSVHVGGINGIDFQNLLTGIAVGDNGNIFKTTDGGNNWIDLGSQSIYIINDIAFINDTLAVAVGASGSYLFSTNIGESWMYKNTNSSETFFAVEKKNSATASIVGTQGAYAEFSQSNLSISDIFSVGVEENWLKDVHCVHQQDSTTKTMIVGFGSTFCVENDGWKSFTIHPSNNLNGLNFFNDTIGLACGLYGKIYKTTSGGIPASTNTLKQVELNLYPIPAKNTLSIQGQFNNFRICIYNTMGQTIINQKLVGNHIDISNIPEGNYYVQLNSDNKFAIGRFTKKY